MADGNGALGMLLAVAREDLLATNGAVGAETLVLPGLVDDLSALDRGDKGTIVANH